MRDPANCHNLGELRDEIDRLDAALVALLAERSRYILRAAELKAQSGDPAFIPERVEQVVSQVKRLASSQDLDAQLVENLWRQIISWSVRQEEQHLKGGE